MAQKKKLQVFVSSTFTDLQEERQAAVQAILTAGHIPAGMELFAAGDETQMNAIKRWIDESDVYMLILGGRYGSIEPKSQKSYIHLEYDYALEKGKPLFAVVIDEDYLEEKVKKDGLKAIEKDHSEKLKEFRELVCSKMVRFWSDSKDIKLAILETMAEFSGREELIGWISGNEAINTGAVAGEIARLAKENATLREKVERANNLPITYNGLTFDEMYDILLSMSYTHPNNDSKFHKDLSETLKKVATIFGDEHPGLIHAVWLLRNLLRRKLPAFFNNGTEISQWILDAVTTMEQFGLTEIIDSTWHLTDSGKMFLVRLLKIVLIEKLDAESYQLQWNNENNMYKFNRD